MYTKDPIQKIIKVYEEIVAGVDKKARSNSTLRAYGGIIRSSKGKLVEKIAEEVVQIAWKDLGRKANRIEINRKKMKVPISKEYVMKIKNPVVRDYILKNINKHYYRISTDLHIFIDGKFALAIECKSYTENAMFKRILVDFSLLKNFYNVSNFILLQLESQLGGDYSKLSFPVFGSPSTHTLLSRFDINVNIVTLLEGERKVDRPIHKKEYYKPLKESSIQSAISIVKGVLQEY